MKKVMKIIMVALAAFAMASCDKYDDGRPDKDLRNEFARMYPDAFDVEWDWEGTHWEVSFETGKRPNGIEHEAWYDKTGKWIRTKTEVLLTSVPQQILDFLAADPDYGSAPFADNDVDFIETPDGDYYCFELKLNGVDVEVTVNVNGEVTFVEYDF